MSKLFLVNIDMNGNEIDNVVIQPLAAAPANPTIGRIYYDTSEHALKTYNGSGWNQVGAVTSVNGEVGVVVLDQDDVGDGETYKRTHNDLTDDLVTLINGAIQASTKGAANGVAELDSNGKIPESQVPDSCNDVVFGYFLNGSFYEDSEHTVVMPLVDGRLYVDLGGYSFNNNNTIYRASGTNAITPVAGRALGETSHTAYRGDRGKAAYDHSQLTSGNPHNVSKSDVGLGNVDNTSDATKKTNFTGSIASGDTGFVTGDAVNTAISNVSGQIPSAYTSNPAMDGTASPGSSTSWAKGDHVHPTDTSRMAASLKGVANGVAELDANGKVPSSQLPAYVDDVVEGYYYNSKFYEEAAHTTEITGETGKIYVDLSTEKTYRWGGSAYVEISSSLALGETSSTAYRGDRGKTAYDHSQLTSGNPHNVSKSDVGLGNVDNTSDATKKSNFTGSIGDDEEGFVTGAAVYWEVQRRKVRTASGTIATSATSATVNFTGTFINAYALLNGHICVVDIVPGNSSVTFSVAAAPSSAITCIVVYANDYHQLPPG